MFKQRIERTKIWEIDYTDYKGERNKHKVLLKRITFEQYHPDPSFVSYPQFILWAFDTEKKLIQGYAMKDIHSIEQL